VLVAADGRILGEGHTQRTGQAHAEVMALGHAAAQGHDVRGATAYVTLEPCAHSGRTGPCCEAVNARAALPRVWGPGHRPGDAAHGPWGPGAGSCGRANRSEAGSVHRRVCAADGGRRRARTRTPPCTRAHAHAYAFLAQDCVLCAQQGWERPILCVAVVRPERERLRAEEVFLPPFFFFFFVLLF
jgi:hypothetical protein